HFYDLHDENPTTLRKGLPGTGFIFKEVTKHAAQHAIPGASETTAIALDQDGSRLISAHKDGTCLAWDMKGRLPKAAAPKQEKEAPSAWERLASDDLVVLQSAIVELTDRPSRAVALFAEKLVPVPHVKRERIARLIEQLDSDDFKERQEAEKLLSLVL